MSYEIKKSQKFNVIIAGIIGWAHDGFALVLVSLLANDLMAAYSVGKAELGFVMSAQYIMTVFGAAFFGFLADRFGRKNVLLISVLWDSVFTAISPLAPNFIIFAILRMISGLGVSWGISFSLLSESFSPKKRGMAGGLVHATFVVGYIGAVITTMILKPMSLVLGSFVIYGWQLCFLSALFPVPFLIYLELTLSESQMWEKAKKETPEIERVKITELLESRWLKYVFLLTFLFWLSEFAYHVLADWAPTYFEYVFIDQLQTTGGNVDSADTLALMVMLGVMIVAGFALFFTGWISDHIGRQNTFIGCSLIGIVGITIFIIGNFVTFDLLIIIPAVLILTSSFGVHGVFGIWSSETFPTRLRATATSIIFSLARALGLGAFIVGIVSDSLTPSVSEFVDPIGWARALAFGMSLSIIAYILMIFVPKLIPETKGIDISKIVD